MSDGIRDVDITYRRLLALKKAHKKDASVAREVFKLLGRSPSKGEWPPLFLLFHSSDEEKTVEKKKSALALGPISQLLPGRRSLHSIFIPCPVLSCSPVLCPVNVAVPSSRDE
ncbi:hypothetical protein PRIPAC_74564 [Pristionchus pacificus]|uniref:Uncharacterized protein n=1 Tax=Pristionchus pacificus TaxID=54126 RepID=A0A2A6BF82_PRIPA|nr:hypothetical protein PRIPAC_74564 [Pristionchus pacificus]|eukprot:PDM64544.1 hypothetical protein PRIPAC_52800 [Pristionchus pacificus]